MDFVSGGRGKRPSKSSVATKVKQVVGKPVDDRELPSKIAVEQKGTVAATVPGSVWRCPAFKWNPLPFATDSDELHQKFIEPSVQDSSLANFVRRPTLPTIYGVGGNPDDQKAKLFAAYLLAAHCRRLGSDANPWWINLTGGFDNPWIGADRAKPTMIVLCNLTPQSTNHKLEKARDILEAYPDVPRVVVVAGADPMSFLSTRLHVPINALAYFCEAIIKSKVEVI